MTVNPTPQSLNSDAVRQASFIGTLPGPVTGMTLSTLQVVQRLRDQCELREVDLGRSFKRHGVAWRVGKMIHSVVAAAQVIFWKRRRSESIYITINSTQGLLYNVLQIAAARLCRFRCVLHHHVYNYVDTADWRMRWLLRVAGSEAIHVMACSQMVSDLESTYQTEVQSFVVPPAIVSASSGKVGESAENHSLTIGHLSNLTRSKGLIEVLNTFDGLSQRYPKTRMVIAGPCRDPDDRRLLDKAISRHGDRLSYLGAVYGEAKSDFFSQLDVFVFPTKRESWGIVLNEALAAGVPVVSTKIACIPCLVGSAGKLISPDDDFVSNAVDAIGQWLDSPTTLGELRLRALAQGKKLQSDTESKMNELVTLIVSNHG